MGLVASVLGVAVGLGGVIVGITEARSPASSDTSSTPLGDTAGIDACTAIADQAADYGSVSGLVRGETDTGGQVAEWQEQRNMPEISGIVSPLRSAGLLNARVSVCVFRGDFVTPTGPGAADGSVPPPHDTITFIVGPGGNVELDSSGYLNRGGADTPSQWRQRTGNN
jgi:hypothetical protein